MKKQLLLSVLGLSVLFLSGCGSSVDVSLQNKTIQPVIETKKFVYDGVILAIGDSLTEGYQLPIDDAYPAQLKKSLQDKGLNYNVINSGVSGETTTGTRERINWVLSQTDPDIIILTIGANDAMRGIDLDITRSNLTQIVETIQAQNIPIVLGGMEIYENLGADYTNEFKSLYTDIAQEYNLALIPLFLAEVAANPALNLADQIHPNKEGYGIIVERNILPVLEPLLVGAGE